MRTDYDFPQFILAKWQKLIDLLSSTFDLPATLIMQVNKDSMEVFAKCSTEGNPYSLGESEEMVGLYCETVVKSNAKLLVANALADSDWDDNPDIKLGMVAYLGFPLKYPNGDIFGTICVLDNKENTFSKTIEDFLLQVKDIIELDIIAYSSYEKTSEGLEQNVFSKFQEIGLKKESLFEIESELNEHKTSCNVLTKKISQLDNELLKRESKYETLFSSMNAALVVFEPILNSDGDISNAIYIDMNANNETIIGYKKEDVIGKTILDIFPNLEDFWFSKFDFVVKNNKPIRFESFHKGLGKYLSVNVFPVDDGAFAISYYDISAQEILKEKLNESERRYKTIFNESSSIMLLLDPKYGGIVDANSTALKFYGFPKKQLLMMNMHDINIMSTEALQTEIDLVTQKKKNHFQFKHQLANGDIRDVEVYSGTIIADGQTLLHSVIHDVTESRIALEEVNRLSMAVEQSPIAISMTNLDGDVTYCNPKHCELTGYTNEEIVGMNPRILKSGKFSKKEYQILWETISLGGKWSGEFFNKKKDGSYYWELASIASIKNDKGEIVNYIKFGEDISDRKRLENQLSHSILKAEESDKLKTSFLSNLSHEVRTPLNGILGFTNLMLSDDITDEERRDYGAFVESSGNQLLMMMDNILKISMIEVERMSVKFSTFNIHELLLEIEAYYSSEIIEKGLELMIDCNCKSLIRNDSKRVRQVLDSLIRNAIKFTAQGKIIIKAECSNNMLLLSVQDTGIGIESHDHEAIFDRFRQVDGFSTREFEGSGLGLAISKEIVTLLGGEIWLESKIGKGAKFIFTIPNIIG
ncbi:sensor histidine kinase [Ancylomarina sp. YFZ004]